MGLGAPPPPGGVAPVGTVRQHAVFLPLLHQRDWLPLHVSAHLLLHSTPGDQHNHSREQPRQGAKIRPRQGAQPEGVGLIV